MILVVLLTAAHGRTLPATVGLIAYELVAGAVIGLVIGVAGAAVLRRSALPSAGLYPLAAVTFAVLGYAVASVAHASGFLAVYLAGLVLGNSELPHRRATLGFAEGLGSLAQIGLFVLLGLLVSPDRLPPAILPALAVGAVLLVVARPLPCSSARSGSGWACGSRPSSPGPRCAAPYPSCWPRSRSAPAARTRPGCSTRSSCSWSIFTLVQGTSLPWVARPARRPRAGRAAGR